MIFLKIIVFICLRFINLYIYCKRIFEMYNYLYTIGLSYLITQKLFVQNYTPVINYRKICLWTYGLTSLINE